MNLPQGDLNAEVIQALNERRLYLHYQPVIHLASNEVLGCEALCRWSLPDGSYRSPATFLPYLSRQTRSIVSLALCREACLAAQDLPIWVSFNLSSSPLEEPEFADNLIRVLEIHKARSEIILELTEEYAFTTKQVGILRGKGYRLAIDDFGTGWSNLDAVIQYQPDLIKIDKNLTAGIAASGLYADVTRFILNFAHRIGIQVIAEGIETASQAAWMSVNGCEMGQGWYWHPAMELEALKLLL